MFEVRADSSFSSTLQPPASAWRVLTESELHLVAGGDALGDAISCVAAIAAAIAAENAVAGLAAIGACINAIGSVPAPSVADANCVNDNACVDGSVDGTDGNGSAGVGSGVGGCGDSGCSSD